VTDSKSLQIWVGENRRQRVAKHPSAYLACRHLKQLSHFSVYAIAVLLALMLTNGFLRHYIRGLYSYTIGNFGLGVVSDLLGWVALGFLGLSLICLLLRTLIVMVAFARFSLGHVVLFVLAINVLASLMVLLPEWWNGVPTLLLAYIVFKAMHFVAKQDPDGENFTPHFIRTEIGKTTRNDGNSGKK